MKGSLLDPMSPSAHNLSHRYKTGRPFKRASLDVTLNLKQFYLQNLMDQNNNSKNSEEIRNIHSDREESKSNFQLHT